MVADKIKEVKERWHQNRWLGGYSNDRRERGGIQCLERIGPFAKYLQQNSGWKPLSLTKGTCIGYVYGGTALKVL